MPAPKAKKQQAPARNNKARASQLDDEDEIETHVRRKHYGDASDEDDDMNDDYSSEEEGIMDLEGSDEGEDFDDEDDDDDDDDDDDEEEGPTTALEWGKKRSNYYDADNADIEIEEDSDDARLEEQQADMMRKARAKLLHLEDFGDDAGGVKKEKKEKKSKQPTDDKTKAQLAADLAAMSQMVGGAEVESLTRDVRQLSKAEKKHLLLNDTPELLVLIEQFKQNVALLKDKLVPAMDKVKANKMPMSKGISYLQAKLHLVVSYCMHIAFYVLLKAEGRQIKNHPVIESLVEIRALLEKLRPLDSKLRYQIEKLLKMSSSEGETSTDNPLRYKSNIASMDVNDLSDDEDDEPKAKRKGKKSAAAGGADSDEEMMNGGGGGSNAAYRPPRINPVQLEDDDRRKSRKQPKKPSARTNEMIAALREEFGDEPEEAHNIGGERDRDVEAAVRELQEHEEETFTRVTLSKKERNRLKQAEQGSNKMRTFEDFDDFGDIDYLTMEKQAAGPTQDIVQRRSLSDYVAENAKSKKRHQRSADEDLPVRDRNKIIDHVERAKAKRRPQDDDGDFDDEDMGGKRKKSDEPKPAKKQKPFVYRPEEEADGRRGADKRMIDNRGLTPYRSKDKKNPRVKHRNKYAKQQTRLRTGVHGKQKREGPYGGESTGIKSNVVRSMRIGGSA